MLDKLISFFRRQLYRYCVWQINRRLNKVRREIGVALVPVLRDTIEGLSKEGE